MTSRGLHGALVVINERLWCERGDSNPHALRRQILSLVRLPIPPLSHWAVSYCKREEPSSAKHGSVCKNATVLRLAVVAHSALTHLRR
jgi:hypothetical protein